ncbi:hypothetical protein C5688_05870 [Methylocystis sp. MitZ-2018]|nr:hypothetical protein C5688_05870 [Methylocystis sp. MitZ-2018]
MKQLTMMLTTLPDTVTGTHGVGRLIATRCSNSQRRSRVLAEWRRASLIRRDPGPSFGRLFPKRPRAIEGREK